MAATSGVHAVVGLTGLTVESGGFTIQTEQLYGVPSGPGGGERNQPHPGAALKVSGRRRLHCQCDSGRRRVMTAPPRARPSTTRARRR